MNQIKCPHCGAPITTTVANCEYCGVLLRQPAPGDADVGNQSGNIKLHISFGGGNDPLSLTKVNLILDGESLGSFPFKGFEVDTLVSAGSHELVTELKMGPIKRTKEFSFNCSDSEDSIRYQLEHSQLWGNFSNLNKTRG